MKFYRHKLTPAEMAILGLLGAIAIIVSRFSLHIAPTPDSALKAEASAKAAQAFAAIKELRLQKNVPIDPLDDPQESGIIGVEKSEITTDYGGLEAKLTSVNPNWAAVVIDNLTKAGVKKGDAVAIAMTGSFPALNASVITAVETYGAIPIWVVSEGASNWGANIPGLTWLDMEQALFNKGIIHERALMASLGGANNAGGGLTAKGRDILKSTISACNTPLLDTLPLYLSINTGYEAYGKAAGERPVRLFINVGGGLGSLGTSRVGDVLRYGINSPKTFLDIRNEPVLGYAAFFMKRGIPVLNFLNIVPWARSVDLPVAPGAMPTPGIGPLFARPAYAVWVDAVLLIAFCGVVAAVALGLTETVFRNPRREESI